MKVWHDLRQSFFPREGDWRVRHKGRDNFLYEEFTNRKWRHLLIYGELLFGTTAHHAIDFGSPARWTEQPDWAAQRRDEIIARIKSELRPPEYEYYDG